MGDRAGSAATVLLISFAYQVLPEFSLALFDPRNDTLDWIRPANSHQGARGCSGLCRTPFGYAVGRQYLNGPSRIWILDDRFNLIEDYRCRNVFDIHSMLWRESSLYVVSTGNNAVFSLTFDGANRVRSETLHWAVDERFRRTESPIAADLFHINSIAEFDGRMAVSFFGKRPATGGVPEQPWAEAVDGGAVYIDNGETVMADLELPHSLQHIDGEFVVCESRTGGLIFESGEKLSIAPYLRGLASDEHYLYAATSALRRVSEASGVPHPKFSGESSSLSSDIYILEKPGLKVAGRRNMRLFGAEIYDLLVTDRPVSVSPPVDPGFLRNVELEEAVTRNRARCDFLEDRIVRIERSRSWKIIAALRRSRDLIRRLLGK